MGGIARFVVFMLASQLAGLASAGPIEGKFYPEKQRYLVGEPVFVVLELVNPGADPVWVSESCAWLDTGFEALSASKLRQPVSLFGCSGGTAGSCAGGAKVVLPGGHLSRRYLLDGNFRLDAPGVYTIRAWHKVDLYAGEVDYRVVASQEIVTRFDLTLVRGSKKQLSLVYAPILRDLKGPDQVRSWMARSAVVQSPPLFLEDVILSMADDPRTVGASISGLERLATARSKAKLAKLSAAGNQVAIEGLGELGDCSYCPLMLEIAQQGRDYSRFIAMRAAGFLCGERAFPFLRRQLASPDVSTRYESAYALGNTHSRAAVPMLITMLVDSDSNVRRAAGDALAALTHRRSKTLAGAEAIQQEWTKWWNSNGPTAPTYGIDECKQAEPLP
jgi:hypothetical protein